MARFFCNWGKVAGNLVLLEIVSTCVCMYIYIFIHIYTTLYIYVCMCVCYNTYVYTYMIIWVLVRLFDPNTCFIHRRHVQYTRTYVLLSTISACVCVDCTRRYG